jgi:parvulin-like peptidyl-prolyl isomerase
VGNLASKKSSKRNDLTKKIIIAAVIILAVAFIGWQKFAAGKSAIAATVNGEPIYKEDVLAEYIKVPPEYRNIITVDSILEGMVIEKLLLQEAEKMGIETTDEEVDKVLEQLLLAYGMREEDLVKTLEENDATLDDLKREYKKRITINKVLNETVLGDITVTEADARKYYDENPEQFGTPEMIKASHILVNTSAEAKSIRNKALGGAKFDELAQEYSIGPSASRGGDLGFFGKGQMVKEFEDAAFALEDIGDISGIVETQFGFHVIKLTDRKEESMQNFEDIREQIMQAVLQQKQAAAIDIYTAQLESAADIQIYMKSMEEPEGTPISELIKKSKEEKAAKQEEESAVTGATAAEIPQSYESVAECLASKGVRMFGSDTSSISNEQKNLFGDDFSGIDYVDCSENKDLCKENKVISYPTWIISGKKYPGKYSLERLAELAEC